MHVVIAGYGRVGRSLAHELEARGHTVAIVDHDPAAFEEFDEIRGRRIAGEAFDRETLEAAGIRKASCFCATTSGDNTNFVSARVARDRYGVETVIARIYEPRRAGIYRGEGIATISSVEWAMGQFLSSIPGVDGSGDASVSPAGATFAPARVTAARPDDDRPHTVIVGGGKAGGYLAAGLRKLHRITIIEVSADKVAHLRRAMPDVEVLHGDGCEPQLLDVAGTATAAFVAAATGDDEDNLVVSHLVKSSGSPATVVARINHPSNEWLFTPEWGVDQPVGAAAGLYMAVSARCDAAEQA
jgi:Trk K+ transport system NAD-binding subunit